MKDVEITVLEYSRNRSLKEIQSLLNFSLNFSEMFLNVATQFNITFFDMAGSCRPVTCATVPQVSRYRA